LLHSARLDLWPRAAQRVVLALSDLPPEPAHGTELARKARQALAVVVFTPLWRERAVRTLGVDAERVHALPVGCEHWRRDLAAPPERTEDVLVLGARRPSPALAALGRAAASLRADGWRGRLVCAGRPGPADGALRALDPCGAWLHLVEPREVELPVLVASAGLLAYIQPDPGTPVTPLEALALGTPLACLRSAVLGEALGDVPAWVELSEAPDIRAWSRALRAGLRSSPAPGAADLVRRHDWATSAVAHLRLWSRLGSDEGKRRQAHGAS
jgi:glycosyltransferase involved in cell wall biosynthesis